MALNDVPTEAGRSPHRQFQINQRAFMIRENEVRAHVSGARSAENDVGLMSRAVRQTPLTATLSPVRNSFGVFGASDP